MKISIKSFTLNKLNENDESSIQEGFILLKKFREERIKEIEEIRELGINPYPYSYKKTHTTEGIRKQFQNIANGEVTDERVSTAGRVMAIREHGKSTFFHIKDTFGRIQAYVRKDKTENYEFFKEHITVGDIIGVEGIVFKSNTGEVTILVEKFSFSTSHSAQCPKNGMESRIGRYSTGKDTLK